MTTEFKNMEKAYRRGYVQGARALLEAAKLPEGRYQELDTYINGALTRWRLSRLTVRPTTLPQRPPLPPGAPGLPTRKVQTSND